MTTIRLKRLSLTNFKGIRSFDADFDGDVVTVRGRNAIGKTTLADAFSWVLFGKDSKGDARFIIKTLGKDGRPIPHLPHEVTAVLGVDGEDVTLRRCHKEKWLKEYGGEDKLTGHTAEFYYNGEPLSKRDYEAKIAEICDEKVFTCVTNPLWFAAQKPETQRALLLRMAGSISMAEIIGGDPALAAVPAMLGSLTDDEMSRAVAAEKKTLKAQCDDTEARIREREEDMVRYADADYDAIEKEITEKEKTLAAILATGNGTDDEMESIRRRMRVLHADIADKANSERERKERECDNIEIRLNECDNAIDAKTRHMGELEKMAALYLGEKEKAMAAYAQTDAETFDIGGETFLCPTCHRPLEMEGIEAKIAEMEGDFNMRKAQKLAEYKTAIDANKEKYDAIDKDMGKTKEAAAALTKERQRLIDRLAAFKDAGEPDVDALCAANAEYAACQERLAELENNDDAERRKKDAARRQTLRDDIDALRRRLYGRDLLAEGKRRVAELEAAYRVSAQKIAEAERKEALLRAYRDAKMRIMEKRINGMFAAARFKLWETQLNGAVKETCEATLGGVPYSSLNNAARINIGLDIISALCAYEHVAAPIFIDNAESVNELAAVKSQVIRLVVTDDDELKIKIENYPH